MLDREMEMPLIFVRVTFITISVSTLKWSPS